MVCTVSTYFFGIFRRKDNFKTLDWTKFLVLLATMILALKYIKYNVLFFATVYMMMYDDFKLLIDDFMQSFKKYIKVNFEIEWVLTVAFIAYSIVTLIKYPMGTTFYFNTLADFPTRPMQFLKENNIKGKLFAPYYICSFIAWRHYPDYKIYMDGRQEQVYNHSIFRKQMEFLFYYKDNAKDIIKQYPPDIILIEKYWQGAQVLLNEQDYFKPVYEDEKYIIMLPPHLRKFNYKHPTQYSDYTVDNFFKTNLKFTKKQYKNVPIKLEDYE